MYNTDNNDNIEYMVFRKNYIKTELLLSFFSLSTRPTLIKYIVHCTLSALDN